MVGSHPRLIANPSQWASLGCSVPHPLSSRTSLVGHYFLLIAKPPLPLFPGCREQCSWPSPTQLDYHLPNLAANLLFLAPQGRVDHRFACPNLPAEPSAATLPATETGLLPLLVPQPPLVLKSPGPRLQLRAWSSPLTAPPRTSAVKLPELRLKPRDRSSPPLAPPSTPAAKPIPEPCGWSLPSPPPPRNPGARPLGPCPKPRDQPAPRPCSRCLLLGPSVASSWPPLNRPAPTPIAVSLAAAAPPVAG